MRFIYTTTVHVIRTYTRRSIFISHKHKKLYKQTFKPLKFQNYNKQQIKKLIYADIFYCKLPKPD